MFYRTFCALGLVIGLSRKHYSLIFMEKQMFCSQEGAFLYQAVSESTLSQCVFDATDLTLLFEHCFVVMGPFHMTAFPGNKTLTRPRARCQWLQRCGELPIRHKVR